MRQYLDILRKALEEGDDRADRTGIGTRAVFGEMMRFDLSSGFPAVTTKRLAFRSVVAELLWFLAGSSDVNDLHALGEMEALLDQHDVGSSYRDGDVGRLRELVLAFAADPARRAACSRNARALYESRFRSEDIYARYARHVEEVIGGDLRKVG